MRYFHKTKQRTYCPSLNLEKLRLLDLSKNTSFSDLDKKPITIDITKSGFYKVLGKGKVPRFPFKIKAKFFSKKAELKINKAGGECIVVP